MQVFAVQVSSGLGNSSKAISGCSESNIDDQRGKIQPFSMYSAKEVDQFL